MCFQDLSHSKLITWYHYWVTNFAICCPQILTFCEAERYPMATCNDHWPRLEVQRETLLGDYGMRRLRDVSVPVGSSRMQQMQITWEFQYFHWHQMSLNLSELQGIRTITRWPNGRKEAGNLFVPCGQAMTFLPKPGQNCTKWLCSFSFAGTHRGKACV